jgi:hypothetical protein
LPAQRRGQEQKRRKEAGEQDSVQHDTAFDRKKTAGIMGC